MRAADLDLAELLETKTRPGILRLAGQRTVLIDTVALGLLRKELIDTVGETVARGVLTRFGYAHGWRVAMTLKDAFRWDSEREWRIAGARLHQLQGVCRVEVPPVGVGPEPFAEAVWGDSYEAEQHLLHLGRAPEPVCWTLCGYASGYTSAVHGREIVFLEQRCLGCGDADCHVVGRPREEWGDEDLHLSFYDRACMEEHFARLSAELKRAERRLGQVQRKLAEVAVPESDSDPVARSPAMQRVMDLARRVSTTDTTVLVTGESGVGKERVARAIHELGPRAKGTFVGINCGALPEPLLESELFGHAKGAFTGAAGERRGLFEEANGGTLFLDEIGEVSPAMQVKLLRAVQEREVRRVGENKGRRFDARIVAATNRDLAAEVVAGRFRQDLFYRLRVIEIHVPPLRARREDVLPIARAVLSRLTTRMGRGPAAFTPAAADALVRYGWPGNVRELENAVERAVVLCEGARVDLADLPEEVRQPGVAAVTPLSGVRPLHEVEKDYILAVLGQNGGHQAKTAADLDIGTATLYRKLKQWGVQAR